MRQEYDSDGEFVGYDQAEKELSITRRTLERWAKSGAIRTDKQGRHTLVSLSDARLIKSRSNGHSDKTCDTVVSDTITLPISKYNAIVAQFGHFKAQSQYLIEYKNELESVRTKLLDQEREIGRLEGELRALREIRTPWWRRMFSRRS